MKKCPKCNSSRYKEEKVGQEIIRACKKCGYLNRVKFKYQ